MHNKVKSEQCFAVLSVKRVAVFQAHLKVVREEATAQLSNKGNKHSTSQGSKTYEKEDAVNKNDALFWRWQDDWKLCEDDEVSQKQKLQNDKYQMYAKPGKP